MITNAVGGAGAWGKNHIRIFSEIPNVQLKYINLLAEVNLIHGE
jgi:hypothetical protein